MSQALARYELCVVRPRAETPRLVLADPTTLRAPRCLVAEIDPVRLAWSVGNLRDVAGRRAVGGPVDGPLQPLGPSIARWPDVMDRLAVDRPGPEDDRRLDELVRASFERAYPIWRLEPVDGPRGFLVRDATAPRRPERRRPGARGAWL